MLVPAKQNLWTPNGDSLAMGLKNTFGDVT